MNDVNDVVEILFLNGRDLLVSVGEHLYMSMVSLLIATILAVPIGFLIRKTKFTAKIIISIAGILQTIPSLAVLAFFIPFLGIGKVPAVLTLIFYGTLPILQNTYIGLTTLNKNYLLVADGLGMSNIQRIFHVEIPLAIPYILSGIRISAVYLIGWATLASFIGGGGLGDYIFDGLNLYRPDLILSGAIPVIILAFLANLIFGRIEYYIYSNNKSGRGEKV